MGKPLMGRCERPFGIALALSTLAFAACGRATFGPSPHSSQALGASSKPVTTASPSPSPTIGPLSFSGTYVALGDSISWDKAKDSVTFPVLLANATPRLTLDDLAQPGADTRKVLSREVPYVPAGCTFATIEVGIDDIFYDIFTGSETIAQANANFETIVDDLQTVCSSATIAVTAIMKHRWEKPAFNTDANAINAYLAKLPGVVFVELNADPRLQKTGYFVDGEHPNQKGSDAIAEDVEAALRARFER